MDNLLSRRNDRNNRNAAPQRTALYKEINAMIPPFPKENFCDFNLSRGKKFLPFLLFLRD